MADCAFELAPAVLQRVQSRTTGDRIVSIGTGRVDKAAVPLRAGSIADHGRLDPTTSPNPPAEARKIRDLCGRPRVFDAKGVIDFIDRAATAWTAAELASAVSAGNRNEKAPLHFAAQMRADDDCVTMCKALIDRGAVVNATTLRGHTPLIFAAGRGRDKAVQFLLAHGAKARVMTVTGHSAALMGKGRLSPETQLQLELAESAEASEWRDFRGDARALDAQAEHVLHCQSCRAKAVAAARGAITMPCAAAQVEVVTLDETERFEVKQTIDSMLDDVETTVRLGDGLLQALALVAEAKDTASEEKALTGASDSLVTAAAVPRKSDKGSRNCGVLLASGWILRLGMRRLVDEKSPAALLLLLRACREESLARALSRRQMRDRRPIRTILAALLTELRCLAGVSPLHTLQPFVGMRPAGESMLAKLMPTDLIHMAATDPHLTMEVMHLRRGVLPPQIASSDKEQQITRSLWRTVMRSCADGDRTPEVLLISGRQLRKKEGGAPVMLWARCIRWAVGMATGGYTFDSITGGANNTHWRLRRKPRMIPTLELEPEKVPASTSEQQILPAWCIEMVQEVGVAAAAQGRTELLIAAIQPVPAHVSRVWGTQPGHSLLPLQVVQILEECRIVIDGEELGLTMRSMPPVSQRDGSESTDLEEYTISAPPVWVAACDTTGIASVLAELQALALISADSPTMWIGVDTEWGKVADAAGQNAPPAVIQLAVKERRACMPCNVLTWVIDSSEPSAELSTLIHWMFGCASVTVLGTMPHLPDSRETAPPNSSLHRDFLVCTFQGLHLHTTSSVFGR